jgi:solute carrier family 45 protein 1/2/4
MIFGSFVVAFCLIVLGWTAEIVGLFVQDPEKVWIVECVYWIRWELTRARSQARNVTIALAVSSIYAVDFSINVGKWGWLNLEGFAHCYLVQACCRSLIVDTLPIPLQQAGSAWGMYTRV